jgi:hypothetical protein
MLVKINCTGCGKPLTVNVKLEEKLIALRKEIEDLTNERNHFKREYVRLKYAPKSDGFGDIFGSMFGGRK